MKKTSKIRFTLFIIFHIILCSLSFMYTKGVVQSQDIVEYTSDFYIDGTDFTDIANIGVAAFNGTFSLLTFIASAVAMLLISMIIFIPFRIISVKKSSQVTDFELKTTFKIIIGGIVIALLTGIIFLGINAFLPMIILLLPVLIFEIFLYWFGLRKINLIYQEHKNE